MDERVKIFEIKDFLSMKGCLYDNIIVRVNYKIIKTGFANSKVFTSFQ